MKQFVFYKLVDKENICNLNDEKKILLEKIDKNARLVIYAPRNYGKTSLLKNVIIPEFRQKHKKSFVFFADLLQVKDMDSLADRLKTSFEHSFASSFPVSNFIENVKKHIKRLRPEISVDPITSLPGLSIKISAESKQQSIAFIFKLINDIAVDIPTLVVIDEFQDIVNVDEAQAMFRNALEESTTTPILLMGSKRHILGDIFSKPEAPLAFWGDDLEFKPICYEEYHRYIQERFDKNKLTIGLEEATFIQNNLNRNPESINILCHQLVEDYDNIIIKQDDILQSLRKLLANKESRYESYLATFSPAEEKVCVSLAKKVLFYILKEKNF